MTDDDPELRAALSDLRAHDRAPPFDATWRAAEARARRAARTRAVMLLAAAAVAVLAILIARPWQLADRAEPPVAAIDREPLASLVDPLPRLALEERR